MIPPSIGRIVWYHPNDYDLRYALINRLHEVSEADCATVHQPMAAQVVYVHNDRCVNLLVTDHMGKQHARPGITLVQEGDDLPAGEPYGHATWMPYQTAQAKAAPSPALSAPPVYVPPPTYAPVPAGGMNGQEMAAQDANAVNESTTSTVAQTQSDQPTNGA